MKRVLLLAGLVCAGLIGAPRPASAGFMDWLQELSGPGPFNGRAWNAMLDVCPRPRSDEFFVSEYDALQPVACIFVDKRRFANLEGDNFGAGRIDVGLWEVGGSAHVHRAVAIGFGVGRIGFSSQGGDKETWVLTAPRIVVKPALLFADETFWNDDKHELWRVLASVVKYYVKDNIIQGRLTGADFGLTAGDANFNFEVKDDHVWSRGFILDLTEPIGFLLRRLR